MSDVNVRTAIQAKLAGENLAFSTSSGGSRRVIRRRSKLPSSAMSTSVYSTSDVSVQRANLAAADMSLTGRPPRNAHVPFSPITAMGSTESLMGDAELRKTPEIPVGNYIEVAL
jgi:hypothetical protein